MTHHKVNPVERAERLKFWREERARSLAHGQTAELVPYREELSGPGGMSFILLPLPGQDSDAIDRAGEYLVRNRDVVRIFYFKSNELDEKDGA